MKGHFFDVGEGPKTVQRTEESGSNRDRCCVSAMAMILVHLSAFFLPISFPLSGIPYDRFACVHKYHAFVEIRCSSYQQKAVELRLLALQLRQPELDAEQFGGKAQLGQIIAAVDQATLLIPINLQIRPNSGIPILPGSLPGPSPSLVLSGQCPLPPLSPLSLAVLHSPLPPRQLSLFRFAFWHSDGPARGTGKCQSRKWRHFGWTNRVGPVVLGCNAGHVPADGLQKVGQSQEKLDEL